MSEIVFDPEAYKIKALEGPFPTRAALEDACVEMTVDHPAWEQYRQWAGKNGVDPCRGSILTTAYSRDYLQRRYDTLTAQLGDFASGEQTSALKFTIPPTLRTAFDDAAQNQSNAPFRMLSITTTRETLFFDLRKNFSKLDLHTVNAATDETYAKKCNDLITAQTPDLSGKLTYTTDWQNQSYDLVHVNAAIFYQDENGVKETIQKIGDTGAARVVFNNLLPNRNKAGAAEWYGQRSFGGIIPVRIQARGELTALMQKAGYTPIDQDTAAPTFDLDRTSAFATQFPNEVNLSFIRVASPA